MPVPQYVTPTETSDGIDGLVSEFLGELEAISVELKSIKSAEPSEADGSTISESPQGYSSAGELALVPVNQSFADDGVFADNLTDDEIIEFARRSSEKPIRDIAWAVDWVKERESAAVSIYDDMSAAHQENAAMQLLRSWALFRSNLNQEALSLCDKSIQSEPDKAYAWCQRSSILLNLGRPEEALHASEQAIQLDPEASFAWTALGAALSAAGHPQRSLAALEEAALLGDDSISILFKRAQVLLSIDRWREGVALLDQGLQRLSRSSEDEISGDTAALIRTLLPSLASPMILQVSIKALVLIFTKHGMIHILGRGLVSCIRDIAVNIDISHADAELWLESWRSIAGSLPQFRRPLLLLSAAMRFRKSRDLRVLTELPEEDRQLLERILKLHT